jgi:general secretion pathway protein A
LYLDHFSLAEEPFSVTSDPRFLFLSASHEEALAHLLYCVEYRKGFAAITGEIGTGKTILLNTLMSRLDGNLYNIAFVYQCAGTIVELMRYVYQDLGIKESFEDRTAYLNHFNEFLLAENEAGREVVLLIDEGQNLSNNVLEDLRLISNFETTSKKLVQIILAGQSELGMKLRLPELRQLNQRIAIQYCLQPLSLDETASYVMHRLKVAGANRVDIFASKALKTIHATTKGIPRLINQVCDAAMLRAALGKKQVIGSKQVQGVLREDFQFRSAAGRDSVQDGQLRLGDPTNSWRKWVAGLALLLCAGVVGWSVARLQGPHGINVEHDSRLDSDQVELDGKLAEQDVDPYADFATDQAAEADTQLQVNVSQPEGSLQSSHPEPSEMIPLEAQTQDSSRFPQKWVRIREHDTLVKIARRAYGRSDWDVVMQIWHANPQLKNPNLIRVGDLLLLPMVPHQP